MGHDVAASHLHLAGKNFRVGRVTNGNEAAFEHDVLCCTICGAFQSHAGDTGCVAQHFVQRHEGFEFNLAGRDLLHELVHQNGLCLELVPPVNQVHLAGNVGQVKRLFDRRVAAADDTADLVAVEKAVTGGAAGDAAAHEGGLGWQAQVLGRGTGGNDEGVAGVSAAVALEAERALCQVDFVDMVKDDFGVEALGVGLKPLHQFGALYAVHVSRPVVHISRCHELTALRDAGNEDRVEVGAGRINGCAVTGWTRAQDQHFDMAG